MKKLFVFVIILLLLIGVWFAFNDYKKGYNEPEINSDITMSIKDGTLTKTGATITIIDRKEDEEHIYGEYFRIEKKENNKWIKLDTKIKDYGFNDIGYNVDDNHKLELDVDWKYLYGELKSGQYRLVKKIAIKKNDTYVGNKEIYVEFEID